MKTARLQVLPTHGYENKAAGERQSYVKFTASNGETLGVGETHPNVHAAQASYDAWIRAMVEVLAEEGYTVVAHSGEPS